jgi:hypothetical protein
VVLGCCWVLGGCTSWTIRSPGRRQLTGTRVRVTRTDASRILLTSPSVAHDTLHGFAEGEPNLPMAIPLSAIQEIAVREPAILKTLGLIAGLVFLVGGLLFSLAFGQGLREWYGEIAEID